MYQVLCICTMASRLEFILFFHFTCQPQFPLFPSFCSPHLSHLLLRGVKPPLENQQSLASKLTQDQAPHPCIKAIQQGIYHHREWPPKSQFMHLGLVLVPLPVPLSQHIKPHNCHPHSAGLIFLWESWELKWVGFGSFSFSWNLFHLLFCLVQLQCDFFLLYFI